MKVKRFGNVLQFFAFVGILLLGLCADALAEGAATYYVLNRDGTVHAYVIGDNNENAQAYNFGGEFQMPLGEGLEAAIHYVPDNYGTVQACIDAAANGDICRVRPGVYYENIVLNNKTVTIESTDGPATTILDGACAGSVVKLSGFYPAAAVLDGFTVTNGCATDSGGGISIGSITTTLRNCVITNNTAPSGGGIASKAAMVTIENCTISANASTDPLKGGGGIYSYFDLMTTIHSTFSGNTSSGNGGGALINRSTWIDNFAENVDNVASQFGGGVFCENCSYFVNSDVIARNTADVGGGIYAAVGASARVELVNSTVTGNQANEGGGFYSRADSDTLIILNSIMYGNNTLPVFQYVNPCSSIAYSNIEGGFAGQGNINADPLFNNADIGDYHLQPQSPGFNTGTSSAVSTCAVLAPTSRDIDGTPSPQGLAYDMGAYEYIPAITEHPLAVTKAGTGSGTVTSLPEGIDCGGTCSSSINAGTLVTLIASPATDSLFAGWSGACSGTGSCVVTMDSAKSVTATFDQYRTITASAELHGTISPSGNVVVTYGTDQTFTIVPDAGYHVADVLVDGISAGAVTTYAISNVTANHTISASFAQDTHALAVTKTGTGSGAVTSLPEGIDCGGTCSASINSGTLVTLTATSDANSEFSGWGGACNGTGICTVTMDAAKTVEASFTLRTYLFAYNAGANGFITGPTNASFGSSVSYIITPAVGHHVADVLVDGQSIGCVTSYTFTNVAANHTITASFAVDTFTITLTSGTGGTLSGPTTVNFGDLPTYSITPNTGYHVVDVSVNGSSVGTVSSYTFPTGTTTDATITATFALDSYTIVATAGSYGTVSGPASVTYGSSPAYAITPAAGYHIADVLVDGVSVGAVTSYSFTNVTANHNISASFAINTFSITATTGANGTISGPSTVNYGGSASYIITPVSGYRVASLLVDGVSVGVVTSYSFSNVTANHTISATFTALADLIVNSVTGPNNATRGKSISVSSSIKNQGKGNADSFTVTFYLSKDTTVTSGDTPLGTKTVALLNAGSTSTVSGSFTVQSGTAIGKYYVGVIIDSGSAIVESNENNNSKAASNAITIK